MVMAAAVWQISLVPSPLITLTTDFGCADGTVGAMIGVVKSICPVAEVVSIAHDIPPHDIVHGAWALYQSAPFFPPGTIHIAVVDPGVGTKRRAILVETKKGFLLGPDNGMLVWAGEAMGIIRRYAIENTPYRLGLRGLTFDGRDLFATVAAHLANGIAPAEVGEDIPAVVDLSWPEPIASAGRIEGEILLDDRFGNLVTNITAAIMAEVFGDTGVLIILDGKPVGGLSRGYAAIEGHLGAVINGTGLLEIAVPEGSAAALTGGRRGDKIIVTGRI
jgi:S-adenosylmethionine hydrolase